MGMEYKNKTVESDGLNPSIKDRNSSLSGVIINASEYGLSSAAEDNSDAIQSAIDAAFATRTEVIDDMFVTTPTVIIPSGIYNITKGIIHKLGINISSENATLLAMSSMDKMLYTEYNGTIIDPTVFGNVNVGIEGSLVLDGNNLATYGYSGNMVNKSSIDGITAVRCTSKKWADGNKTIVGTFSVGTIDISVNDGGTIEKRDIVRIYNSTTSLYENGMYTVMNVNTNTVTLDNGLVGELDSSSNSYELHNIPTGIVINGNQNVIGRHRAFYNTCGIMFSASTKIGGNNAIFDDNSVGSILCEFNDIGVAISGVGSTIFHKITAQHSKYENLVVTRCGAIDMSAVYIEADNNFVSLDSEDYALVYACGQGIAMNIYFPTNTHLGWTRLMKSDVNQLRINVSCGNALGTILENPNFAGDYALIQQLEVIGKNFTYLNVSNCSTLQVKDAIKNSIVNASHSFPSNRCRITSNDWANGDIITAGNVRSYDDTEWFSGTENYSRVKVSKDGVLFGDGSSAPSEKISMQDGGAFLGTGADFLFTDTMMIKNASGINCYLFVDGSNRLRISTSKPTDKNANGTIIGTQS